MGCAGRIVDDGNVFPSERSAPACAHRFCHRLFSGESGSKMHIRPLARPAICHLHIAEYFFIKMISLFLKHFFHPRNVDDIDADTGNITFCDVHRFLS